MTKGFSIFNHPVFLQLGNYLDLIPAYIGEQHITAGYFIQLSEVFCFSDQEWAAMLEISTAELNTFHNEDLQLTTGLSARILQISLILKHGMNVFESLDQLHNWLQSPNVSLGGHIPSTMLLTPEGTNLVIHTLIRIEQGIFS